MKFFDIHTHHFPQQVEENRVVIYNLSEADLQSSIDNTIPNLFYSCGIHPWHVDTTKLDVQTLESLIASNKKIVAMGECGLDSLCQSPMQQQKEMFVAQIKLANKLNLPMIIHCVRSWDLLLKLYKEHKPSKPWIIHGFRGAAEQAKQLQKAGFYFSMGEYFNSKALKVLHSSSLFLETDESLLSISQIYDKVTGALSLRKEDIAEDLEQNVSKVFNLRVF